MSPFLMLVYNRLLGMVHHFKIVEKTFLGKEDMIKIMLLKRFQIINLRSSGVGRVSGLFLCIDI